MTFGRSGARRHALAVAMMLAASTAPVSAVQPDEVMPDRALEARARAISSEVRCLVCQNQSIDDSDAPLARDLRLLVRDRLRAGDDDGSVKAFIVSRYGSFVLLRPPFEAQTLVLWFGPPLILGAAIGGLILSRTRRAAAPSPKLTEDEEARLRDVLGTGRG